MRLMTLLRWVVVAQQLYLHIRSVTSPGLHATKHGVHLCHLCLVHAEDGMTILRAVAKPRCPPAHPRRRKIRKVAVKQLFKRYDAFVKDHPNRLGMPRVGAHRLVGRGRARTVCVAGLRIRYAANPVHGLLQAPEAAPSQIDLLHASPPTSPRFQ